MAKRTFVILLFLSLISVPFMRVHAIPPGIGVIGDSASEPYRCIGRGSETSFTWTEILAMQRGLDFGSGLCQEYNHAGSGEKIAVHMASQTAEVVSDFNAGKIGRVIIFLGYNDLYSSTGAPDVPFLLATYRNHLETLIQAGLAPADILLIDIPQENWQGPIKALVDQFNAGLRDMAIEEGTAFSSFASFYAEKACRSTDGEQTYNIGGQTIRNTWGDEWHNFRLADGHLGTLANGILANTQAAGFLHISRLSDAEMLSVVNGQVIPSNPPPDCAPTPTPTLPSETPGSTLTDTPAATGTTEADGTPTGTLLPADTASPTPTDTPFPVPTETSTLTATFTPSNTPTATATVVPITIGERNILSFPYSGLGNRLVAQQVSLSQGATIQSLSYYVATASGQLRLGIYNNGANGPGSLVAQTAAFTPVSGWNTRNVETQAFLPAGTYWLAFLPQNNTLTGRVAQSGTGRHYTYTFGSLPGTFSSSATSDIFHFSLYATLLAGVPPSNTPTDPPTNTPTGTSTPSATPSRTPTSTPTHTSEPSSTPTNTLTNTPFYPPADTLTPSSLPTYTPTHTLVPAPTDAPTNTPTNPPTETPEPTLAPTGTATATPAPTNTPTHTPTNTPSPSPTPSSSPTATGTHTPTRTPTDTPASTATNTALPSATPTSTATGTPTASLVPSNTPTWTSTATATTSTITVGETRLLGTRYSGMGNQLAAQQVNLSQSATIQSLSFYVATASGQLRLGIYNNAGNAPGSLVAQTAAFTPVTGWNTQPVLAQSLLPAGTYWLAFLPQNNSLAGRLSQSGIGRHYNYTFGALPATFSSSAASDKFHFSLYATLLTSSP